MNGTWLQKARMALVGALGATVLLGTPLLAQADQGKWWTPKEGNRSAQTRGARSYSPERTWGYRGRNDAWRGARIHRDVIVIRDGNRGNYFRARRYLLHPRFHRHVVFVRPVRYFIAADACIGGIGIHARFRPHDLYGCNFCDARFESYGAYHSHVLRCDARPDGYRVAADDWNADWDAGRDARYDDEESWDD